MVVCSGGTARVGSVFSGLAIGSLQWSGGAAIGSAVSAAVSVPRNTEAATSTKACFCGAHLKQVGRSKLWFLRQLKTLRPIFDHRHSRKDVNFTTTTMYFVSKK